MQKIEKMIVCAATALAFLPACAQAIPPVAAQEQAPKPEAPASKPAASEGVAAQLEQLQTEVMLLKAETARANAQADFDRASGVERSGRNSAGRPDMPQVKSIFGRDQEPLRAMLKLASGSEVEVASGDTLPGGYKVGHVDASQVVFVNSGKSYAQGLTASMAAAGAEPLKLLDVPPLPGR
jgi:type IV pilus biogenesis protein PilP